MSFPKLLVFTPSFIGTKSSLLWSRIYEEYQHLSKKFKIIVITGKISTEKNENISIIPINKISILSKNLLFRMLCVSYTVIKQRKLYDLVFIRILDYSMLAGILAKKLLNKKLIVYISNIDPGFKGIKRMLHKLLYKKTLSCANTIIFPSSNLIDQVENYIGTIDKSKIAFIKTGINTSRFKPLNIERNKNEILFVGRVDRIKGIEDILHALSIVIKSIPYAKLKIIGNIRDKNYYNDLLKLISKLHCEKNVEFVGPIPHYRLVDYYNSASIFAITSRNEAAPQVVLEAMACELPVIVTPVGNLVDIIVDGENGFLVKPNQLSLLAERIITLLNNEDLRIKIGKAAGKVGSRRSLDDFIEELSKSISDVTIDDTK